MTPVAVTDLQPIFADVETRLAAALDLLKAGEPCTLDGLADRVETLCRQALRIGASERGLVLSRLGGIVETLARLERGIAPAPRP